MTQELDFRTLYSFCVSEGGVKHHLNDLCDKGWLEHKGVLIRVDT